MDHYIHGKIGLCAKAGIGRYQSGLLIERPNVTVDDFRWAAEQCRHRCNQLAFGGRGDPDQHECFEELLRISREYDLVPNFTTSGYGMTPVIAALCKRYCGAVAVSWYHSEYTTGAIRMLHDAGVKTNIHYVLGNNSIDEAIRRLRDDNFPKGINAVIFLLHKSGGQETQANVLSVEDARVAEFFLEFDRAHPFKVGMDSCTGRDAIRHCRNVLPESLDTCEGGRFSCYVGPNMLMVPCSFDQEKVYRISACGRPRGGPEHRGGLELGVLRALPLAYARLVPGLLQAGLLHGRLPAHARNRALRRRCEANGKGDRHEDSCGLCHQLEQ